MPGAAPDDVVLRFTNAEAGLLRSVVAQLREVLEGGVPPRGSDPVRERLFPRAYLDPTEDEAESEWQAFVHDDLVRERTAALDALVGSLDAAADRGDHIEVVLGPDDVERWVGAVNDARLALGVVLDVSEDDADEEVPADDPRHDAIAVYHFLGYLQTELVDVLLGRLPG